eukprot:4587865-Pyramimonas_sp.AAC.1
MFGAARELAPPLGHLVAAPSPVEGLAHMCYHSQAAARAMRVAAPAAASRTSDGKSTRPLLGADWGRKRCMHMHAEADQIPPEATTENDQWRCARAGVHLCEDSGKRTQAFRNSVLRMLTVRRPKESSMRKLLVDGRLCVCLLKSERNPSTFDSPLGVRGRWNRVLVLSSSSARYFAVSAYLDESAPSALGGLGRVLEGCGSSKGADDDDWCEFGGGLT